MGAHEPATLTDSLSMEASSSSEFVGAQSLATPPTDCMAHESADATAGSALGMFEPFILFASIAAVMCTDVHDPAGRSRMEPPGAENTEEPRGGCV
jgi:hypothetical protein